MVALIVYGQQFHRNDGAHLGRPIAVCLQFPDREFAGHIARRQHGDKDRRLPDIVDEKVDVIAGLEIPGVEENLWVVANPLAQRILQVDLESAHPVHALRIGLVVEMRIADEQVVLEARDNRHRTNPPTPSRGPFN